MEVNQDAVGIFSYVVGLAWDLLSWEMPGMAIPAQGWVIMVVTINITLAALHFAFGLGGSGTGYRSGDSRKKYISEKRRGDEL